jgi:hypothetical protein
MQGRRFGRFGGFGCVVGFGCGCRVGGLACLAVGAGAG